MRWNIKSELRRRWLLFEIFLKKFNEILDKHAPYKKLSIQEVKLSKKTWITTGILNSIKNKNKIMYGHKGKRPSEKKKLKNK